MEDGIKAEISKLVTQLIDEKLHSDSIEVGNAKTGTLKMYGNFNDVEGTFLKKLDKAKPVMDQAKAVVGMI